MKKSSQSFCLKRRESEVLEVGSEGGGAREETEAAARRKEIGRRRHHPSSKFASEFAQIYFY